MSEFLNVREQTIIADKDVDISKPISFKITGMEIRVLDHGYVRLVDHMGSDISIVNAARVSFDKESSEFSDKDGKLINFLGKNGHTSPFRHATLTFEVYAPLFVARQWWKYVVGHSHDPIEAWNESSRRYVTEEPVFYIPRWRSSPENKKQGSGEPMNGDDATILNILMEDTIKTGVSRYEMAIKEGVAPEQARVFFPAYAMYVRWRWTCSLQGAFHLIEQRMQPEAQWEFQKYAEAVFDIVGGIFPVSTKAYIKNAD